MNNPFIDNNMYNIDQISNQLLSKNQNYANLGLPNLLINQYNPPLKNKTSEEEKK